MNYEINPTVQQSIKDSQYLLTDFLANPDNKEDLRTAFGENFDLDRGLSEIESLVENDFSNFPQIEIRPASEINHAQGAYSIGNNTIYLAQEFVTKNASNIDAISQVIIEEIGHYIDFKANIADAPGDDGGNFCFIGNRRRFKQLPVGYS